MIQLSILKFLKNNKVNNIYIEDEKDTSLDKRKTLYVYTIYIYFLNYEHHYTHRTHIILNFYIYIRKYL